MDEIIDFKSEKFYAWLESSLEQISKKQVYSMAMQIVCANGDIHTANFNATVTDLRLMAHALLDEATMFMIEENLHGEEEEENQ